MLDMLQDTESRVTDAWLDDVYTAIRKHPITPENCWLVGVSASLAVSLTSAYARIDELEQQLAP